MQRRDRLVRTLLVILLATSAYAAEPFRIDAAAVRKGELAWLPTTWEFRATPPIPMSTILPTHRIPPEWKGDGWFALTLDVPSEVVDLPLALDIRTLGTSDIYLDSYRLGTRAHEEAFVPFQFDQAGPHVRLGLAEAVQHVTVAESRHASFPVWFYTAVFLSFGLLHFCHWVFQRDAIDHLWFA